MRLRAHAKVTLSLRVLGVREDGFHEIDALVVSAREPHDELELVEADRPHLTVTGPFAATVPADETNLVARALQLTGRTMAVSVSVYKAIPPGAGLGGGSADAAAVLRAYGGTDEQAAAIGSDVPFCLHGGPARMRGRGEIIDAITGLPPLHLVIVAPEFGCATPEVYRAWDDLGGPTSDRVVDAPAGYPGPFVNDLEPAAERAQPRLREFRTRLESIVGRPALLCGSGSACASWFAERDAAESAARRAQEVFGAARTWCTHTITT